MKKTVIPAVITFALAGLLLIVYFNFLVPKVASKIIRDKTKIVTTKDGKTEMLVPMAKLPEKQDVVLKDTLEGTVSVLSYSSDSAVPLVILINKQGETIVPTNAPYVHSLAYFYLGKQVVVKGSWRKDAVILGKQYRSFWVEEVDPAEK